MASKRSTITSPAWLASRPTKRVCTVNLYAAPGRAAVLVGDALRLGQVLVNLGNNAVKFTETGAVEIGAQVQTWQSDGVVMHFWVRDTGIGLTAAQQERLFQSFSQADASITRKCRRYRPGAGHLPQSGGPHGWAHLGGKRARTRRRSTLPLPWAQKRPQPIAGHRGQRHFAASYPVSQERYPCLQGARVLVEDNPVGRTRSSPKELFAHGRDAGELVDNGQMALDYPGSGRGLRRCAHGLPDARAAEPGYSATARCASDCPGLTRRADRQRHGW